MYVLSDVHNFGDIESNFDNNDQKNKVLTSKKGKIESKQCLFGRRLLRKEGKMLTNRQTYCRQLILFGGRGK